MSVIFARLRERNPQASMPFFELSIENNSLSVSNATRRSIAENTMDYVSLIWHTTPMHQKNVGDSVRAGCGDKPHVRFGRGGATRSCLTSCGSRRQRHLTWGSAPSTLPGHAVGVIRRCEALGTMNASLVRVVVNP